LTSNNTWEIAEAYVAGTLPEADVNALHTRLGNDADFANEFHESVNLIKSF